MKNLLLHAKYIAHTFETASINMEHIEEAIQKMSLGKKKIRNDILEYVNKHHVVDLFAHDIFDNDSEYDENITDCKTLIDKNVISEASQLEKINFESDVKLFISAMKEKGYNAKGEEIPNNLYIEGYDILLEAKKMKKNLSSKLYGQTRAIESVTDSVKNNILANENEPKSTYLFLGPPATGKTYMADLIGENLEEYKVKKFDMTQYSHEESGGNLFGTARHWGNTKPGGLTSFVRKI